MFEHILFAIVIPLVGLIVVLHHLESTLAHCSENSIGCFFWGGRHLPKYPLNCGSCCVVLVVVYKI